MFMATANTGKGETVSLTAYGMDSVCAWAGAGKQRRNGREADDDGEEDPKDVDVRVVVGGQGMVKWCCWLAW